MLIFITLYARNNLIFVYKPLVVWMCKPKDVNDAMIDNTEQNWSYSVIVLVCFAVLGKGSNMETLYWKYTNQIQQSLHLVLCLKTVYIPLFSQWIEIYKNAIILSRYGRSEKCLIREKKLYSYFIAMFRWSNHETLFCSYFI